MERKIVTLDNLEYFYEKLKNELCDKTYVDNSIAELVDGAPETLDTLNELAAALNDNADIVDVLNQSISNKQDVITDLETIRQGAAKGAFVIKDYILNNYINIVDISDNPYNYYHDIIDERITEDDFANVAFDVNDALSGIFSPTCETFNGYLRIYSKSNLITTIPSILIYKL